MKIHFYRIGDIIDYKILLFRLKIISKEKDLISMEFTRLDLSYWSMLIDIL